MIALQDEEGNRRIAEAKAEMEAAQRREIMIRRDKALREATSAPRPLEWSPLSLSMDVDVHWRTHKPESTLDVRSPTDAPVLSSVLTVDARGTVELGLSHLRIRPREAPATVAEEDDVEEDDVATAKDVDTVGSGEVAFAVGMRRAAMDYDAHDVDGDQKLDFGEFCAMVRERETGEHTDEELKERFKAIDADGSGQVDMNEYVRYSLRDALSRSSQRVMDLFKTWDEDGSGQVDKKEFRIAIKAMGFDFFANDAEIDMVFTDFDTDKSGEISYKELNEALRKIKLPHKALRSNPPKPRGSALAAKFKFKPDRTKTVQQQLTGVLSSNALHVKELIMYWDDDGNGLIDKKEFRRAIAALGIEAARKEVDATFDTLDEDKSGSIDYRELTMALRKAQRQAVIDAATKPLPPAPCQLEHPLPAHIHTGLKVILIPHPLTPLTSPFAPHPLTSPSHFTLSLHPHPSPSHLTLSPSPSHHHPLTPPSHLTLRTSPSHLTLSPYRHSRWAQTRVVRRGWASSSISVPRRRRTSRRRGASGTCPPAAPSAPSSSSTCRTTSSTGHLPCATARQARRATRWCR